MKLPAQRKILREDLKGAPEYVNGIIDPVNSFMESTYQALNKNLTLNENIASFVKEITYLVPFNASYKGIIPSTATTVSISAPNRPLYAGNEYSLVFDGVKTISTTISDWNAANPSAPMTLDAGVGSQIPTLGTTIYLESAPFITFKNELRVRPTGVMVMQAYDSKQYTPALGPVYASWILNKSGDIEVRFTGLYGGYILDGRPVPRSYTIRMVVF